MTVAFYGGSFDPVTNGHLDVLRQAFRIADRVVVGIGIHPGKTPIFSFAEREVMLTEAIAAIDATLPDRLAILSFRTLVTEAAAAAGATLLVRGLRDGTDFDFEMQMAGMNGTLRPDIVTVFLPASPATRHITGTLVRQIAMLGGSVTGFVPPNVAERLAEKAGVSRAGGDA